VEVNPFRRSPASVSANRSSSSSSSESWDEPRESSLKFSRELEKSWNRPPPTPERKERQLNFKMWKPFLLSMLCFLLLWLGFWGSQETDMTRGRQAGRQDNKGVFFFRSRGGDKRAEGIGGQKVLPMTPGLSDSGNSVIKRIKVPQLPPDFTSHGLFPASLSTSPSRSSVCSWKRRGRGNRIHVGIISFTSDSAPPPPPSALALLEKEKAAEPLPLRRDGARWTRKSRPGSQRTTNQGTPLGNPEIPICIHFFYLSDCTTLLHHPHSKRNHLHSEKKITQ